MTKVKVVFYTRNRRDEATRNVSASSSRPQRVELQLKRSRKKLLTTESMQVYGRWYSLTTYTLGKPEVGIRVTRKQLTQLLADAREQKEQKKKVRKVPMTLRQMAQATSQRAAL